MRQHELILNYGQNTLSDIYESWYLPILYINGHSFVNENVHGVLFTKPELQKLHSHFHRPSTGKLCNLLKRADTEHTDQSVKDMLDEISKACANCAEYHSCPFRFRASIPPEELQFIHELAIDLMWLSGQPVMCIIDTHTLYQTAEFVKSKSANDLWDKFTRCWDTIFVGYPSTIRLDHETDFDSEEFRTTETETGIVLQFSGIESNNSLGVGEKYHGHLRRVYNKIKDEHDMIDNDTALRLALKECNDTLGADSLVPTLLVFGVLPALRPQHHEYPNNVKE